jgi:hypothetical protein
MITLLSSRHEGNDVEDEGFAPDLYVRRESDGNEPNSAVKDARVMARRNAQGTVSMPSQDQTRLRMTFPTVLLVKWGTFVACLQFPVTCIVEDNTPVQ